jgi:hypothetical protein
MSGTGFKIPPVAIAVFVVGELVMFGAGFLVGGAFASNDKPDPESEQRPAASAPVDEDWKRQVKALEEQLAESGKRGDEFKTKYEGALERVRQANEDTRLAHEGTYNTAAKRDEALAGLGQTIEGLKGELRLEQKKYAELEAIAFPGKPKLVYGQWADMPELRTSNWKEAGAAADSMVKESLKGFYDHLMSGKGWGEIDPELMEKVQQDNLKLIELAGKFNKKVPTHATNVNGSFAHPVLQFNLLASALEKAGHPLSDRQLEDLTRAGELYDQRYEEAQRGYTPETYSLVKLLDELELKLEASAVLDATLTPEQHKAAFPEGMRHLSHFDIYSPTLMLATHVGPLTGMSREELRQSLMAETAKNLGFDPAALATHGAAFDTYLTDCASLLAPMPAMQAGMLYTGPDALKAGRAQLRMIESLVSLNRPDEGVMEKIRKSSTIAMPRIIKPME